MGDKGGRKDKEKSKQQQVKRHTQEDQQKAARAQPARTEGAKLQARPR